MQESVQSTFILCNFHVCKCKNAYIKVVLMRIYIGTQSQPLLQNRLMDFDETW